MTYYDDEPDDSDLHDEDYADVRDDNYESAKRDSSEEAIFDALTDGMLGDYDDFRENGGHIDQVWDWLGR